MAISETLNKKPSALGVIAPPKAEPEQTEEVLKTEREYTAPAKAKPPKAKAPAEPSGQQIELEDAIRTKTGRPIGKSKNPEFTQLGPYVRKTTKKAVELRLMQEGEQEMSDLIESLLIKWLAH